MYWNYRILKRHKEHKNPAFCHDYYSIIEVYYEDDKIMSWADCSEDVCIWEDYNDLKETVLKLLPLVFEKPVLTLDKNDELIEEK